MKFITPAWSGVQALGSDHYKHKVYIKQEINAQIILRTRKEYYRSTNSFKCAIECRKQRIYKRWCCLWVMFSFNESHALRPILWLVYLSVRLFSSKLIFSTLGQILQCPFNQMCCVLEWRPKSSSYRTAQKSFLDHTCNPLAIFH